MYNIKDLQDKKAVYYTLGCKLNFSETSTLEKQMVEYGIRRAMVSEKADICVINTCSVTELADKKCRQTIRRIKKQHPDAIMIVTGCYAQLKPDEVRRIKGVDWILEKNIQTFTPSCSRGERTRYFLKVQDGCDYFCSYCTIPFARGRSRNGQIADLIQAAEQVGREGGKEIVLTGVNIGDFGKTTGESFCDLLRALDNVKSIERFRISSIEPNLLTDEILTFVSHSKRFSHHFHMPLQSGCDAVLKLMHRKYDIAFFLAKIEKIKTILPDAFIGVDVITGMRGELPKHFKQTWRFLEDLPIAQLHVFPYSERPGTMALKIEPAVASKEKQERSKQLLALSKQKLKDFYRSQYGTKQQVLFEHTQRGDKMYGFTGNYIKVETKFNSTFVNRLTDIILDIYEEETNCYRYSELER